MTQPQYSSGLAVGQGTGTFTVPLFTSGLVLRPAAQAVAEAQLADLAHPQQRLAHQAFILCVLSRFLLFFLVPG